MDRTEKLSIEQKIYRWNRKAIDKRKWLLLSKLKKNLIFVAKTRNYDIFVAKIYDTHLSIAFEDFPGSSKASQVMPPWQQITQAVSCDLNLLSNDATMECIVETLKIRASR